MEKGLAKATNFSGPIVDLCHMKAAVLNQLGEMPVYGDFPDPIPQNADQLVLKVKAAALKNIDKLKTAPGTYLSYRELPAVVGIDGVGVLEDGTTVYAQGITGMMAEKALIAKGRYTVLPKGIDPALAAALPNAVLGSAMALHARAKLKTGDVVVINGATGVTGKVAVQVAKQLGASRVIAIGRNASALEKLHALGADELIHLGEDDKAVVHRLKEIEKQSPIDIVIDYLWGRPAELLIHALRVEGPNANMHKIKLVTVGDMAGQNMTLNSAALRSADIEILGSGLGNLTPKDFTEFSAVILPKMFALAVEGKLTLDTQQEDLKNIHTAWHSPANGKRMVLTM
jgi:NADPH:quinone reductase-like Zn-dependent oxidoreductase